MRKFSILIYSLFLFSQFSLGKDYRSFSNDLSDLKREYRVCFQNEKEIDELKHKKGYISLKISDLKNEIEKYVESNELNNNDDFHILLIEISEFESFTSRSTCECLFYFNKFLSEIGAQSYFINQQENIKVFVAVAGNFKLYYAYSLNNWLQTVTINTRMTNGYEKSVFGLYEEVEVFRITRRDEKTKTFNVKVKILKKEKKIKYNECEDKFPRL